MTPLGARHRDPVDQLRAVVERRLGLQLDDARRAQLAQVLPRRLEATRLDCDDYLAQIERAPLGGELGALAQELTIGETYFFRNVEQFRALTEAALPQLVRARRPGRTIRLLSAGCASGEEPYSLAIAVREAAVDAARPVSIRAIDANPAMLARARRARYQAWALREAPAELQRRYFREAGRDRVLSEVVRGAVTFQHRNLAVDDAELWAPDSYDVVFCRNVLMYLARDHQVALVDRITRALVPGGYLFLGHAETLRELSQQFVLCHTHAAFYYRRDADPAVVALPVASASPVGASDAPARGEAWVDAIRAAAERIEALTELRAAVPAVPVVPVAAAVAAVAPGDLASALDLVRRERFGDALAVIERMPATARDGDVRLVQAALLAHGGQLAAAEDACGALLAIDPRTAGAHYVLSLCRAAAGDRTGADQHGRAAAYLDPTFAMPRLQLGLAARRTGDHGAARRELACALMLLERESPSRLLLFGGGFDRDALIALCRAELAACGAAR